MKARIIRKWDDTRGSTMIFAMAVFLVATIFSAALLMKSLGAATDAADAIKGDSETMGRQTYLTLQSAANLIRHATETGYLDISVNFANSDETDEEPETGETTESLIKIYTPVKKDGQNLDAVSEKILKYFKEALTARDKAEAKSKEFKIIPAEESGLPYKLDEVNVTLCTNENDFDITAELVIADKGHINLTFKASLIFGTSEEKVTNDKIGWTLKEMATPTPPPEQSDPDPESQGGG